MIIHENRLPADDSHEISCLICYFEKTAKFENCRLLQFIGGALRVKTTVVVFIKKKQSLSASINSLMCFSYDT